jgi:endonuclease/exonuclease/phosphatase (EEP) superfamily protein YafD
MDLPSFFSAVAAVSALLAVAATVKTARQLRAAEASIASQQIDSSFRLLREQLDSQNSLALTQISSAKELALEELRAQVLTKNRQEWINDIRNTLAHFIVSTHRCRNSLMVTPEKRDLDRIGSNVDEAWLHLTRLRLLINSKENDHRDLVEKANLMFDMIQKDGGQPSLMEVERDLLVKGQEILKREWERVKSLA